MDYLNMNLKTKVENVGGGGGVRVCRFCNISLFRKKGMRSAAM